MKKSYLLWLLCSVIFLSCKGKKIELPHIEGATQTEILDYSTIYVFYNPETQKAVLNENNLITSTHWVFHIDRRLSLTEAGKAIVKMQDKKEKPGMHSNPSSRNFFSVADMQYKQLKFVEFTQTRFRLLDELPTEVVQLSATDLPPIAQKIIAEKKALSSVYIDGTITFEEMLAFLQKIQSEGIFIKEVFIKS